MRGGAQGGGGDPLGMAGSDYAELCDLAPSRWSSRSGGVAYHQVPQQLQQQQQPHPQQLQQHHHHNQHHHHHSGHVRSNSSSFEAEDVGLGPYGVSSRIGNRFVFFFSPLFSPATCLN